MTDGVRITVHFHGGTTAVTTLTASDIRDCIDDENDARMLCVPQKPAIDSIDEVIESVLTRTGKPAFQWLGDLFIHPQAVCGVELLDLGSPE